MPAKIRALALATSTAVLIACVRLGAQDLGPLVHEGVVDAPPSQVWAAFTTSAGLRSWMAPVAEIDLRIGGRMKTNYNAQGTLDDPQAIENTILAFEPERMLSMKVAAPPVGFPFPNAIQKMWSVVYFQPEGAGRTRVRAVSLGFGPDEESQKMRAFFDKGNAQTLSQLQKRFAGASR